MDHGAESVVFESVGETEVQELLVPGETKVDELVIKEANIASDKKVLEAEPVSEPKATESEPKQKLVIEADYGQSTPEDDDLYTTR